MADAFEDYAEEVRRQTDYSATWLPGTPMTLADIGLVDDGLFSRQGNTRQFGITIGTADDPQPDDQFTFQSSTGVDVYFKAAGETNAAFETVPQAKAGVAASFTSKHGVVFAMHGVTVERIDDLIDFKRQARDLIDGRRVRADQVFVTEVIRAQSGTVLLSNSTDAKIELSAEADLSGLADLGKIEFGFKLGHTRDMQTEIIAGSGLTPLWRGIRLREDFWGHRDWDETLALRADVSNEDLHEAFEEVIPERVGAPAAVL